MQLQIQLYISGHTPESDAMLAELDASLKVEFPGQYSFDVIDVLVTPEKAVENDVFATPMLLRTVPEPVLKLIGKIARVKKVVGLIRGWDQQQPDQIVIV